MDPVDLAAARRHDPVRIALLETVHTDPPRIGGFLVTLYLAAAVLYFIICYALSWTVKRLHQKIAIIR